MGELSILPIFEVDGNLWVLCLIQLLNLIVLNFGENNATCHVFTKIPPGSRILFRHVDVGKLLKDTPLEKSHLSGDLSSNKDKTIGVCNYRSVSFNLRFIYTYTRLFEVQYNFIGSYCRQLIRELQFTKINLIVFSLVLSLF